MKYILDYLREERSIEPVNGSKVELKEDFADYDLPVGNRLIVNDKDVEIVVWYADYAKWLENKYEQLKLVN